MNEKNETKMEKEPPPPPPPSPPLDKAGCKSVTRKRRIKALLAAIIKALLHDGSQNSANLLLLYVKYAYLYFSNGRRPTRLRLK